MLVPHVESEVVVSLKFEAASVAPEGFVVDVRLQVALDVRLGRKAFAADVAVVTERRKKILKDHSMDRLKVSYGFVSLWSPSWKRHKRLTLKSFSQ